MSGKSFKLAALLMPLALVLAACTPETPLLAPTATLPLLRLASATPSPALPTATPGLAATPVIIASPTPTATPVTHAVAAGETLLSIAIDYGVSLEALQAANPTVQARFLSIGTLLVIPPPEGVAAISATNLAPPAPAHVVLSAPACYPAAAGALYCFVEARNPGEEPVENVSARVILAGIDGLPLVSEVAFSALDVIGPGQSAPLSLIIHPAPQPAIAASAVEILTANLALEPAPSSRAIALQVVEQAASVEDGGVTISGQVRAPDGQPISAGWVVLTVYDQAGAILGYRKLALPAGLDAGQAHSFSISADSLGGPAQDYRLRAEGRP